MTMTKLILGLVGVLAVTGIAASLAIHHSGRVKLREKAEALRQQTEQITRLSSENERLSNRVVRASGTQALAQDQLRELLRLRGQIEPLRQAATEQAQLQVTNAQLRAALALSERQSGEARAVPNFWAKDQLTFAGYADPEAALKTLLWAMNNGDAKSYLASWVSGPDVNMLFENQLRDKAGAELAAGGRMLTDTLGPAVGFHILDKSVKTPDEVVLNLSFDGEGKTRKFVMQRGGNEWKVADLLFPGQSEP
jgi:TolA-binding protein